MYQVSNLGRVRSLGREFPRRDGSIGSRKAQIKKQCETSKRNGRQGYLCTRLLNKDNESKCKLIHILVAQAFIPNPENKPTVNHIDGNKHNNKMDNLEWNTYSENNRKAVEVGLRRKYIGFLKDYTPKN